MDDNKKKVFTIVACILFGFIVFTTVSTLIDLISVNIINTASYNFLDLIILMESLTIVLSACLIAITIFNFFNNNKLKVIEIIISSALIIVIIAAIFAFPLNAVLNTDKVLMLALFSSYMMMLFVNVFYIISRLFLFFFFKNKKIDNEEPKKNIRGSEK